MTEGHCVWNQGNDDTGVLQWGRHPEMTEGIISDPHTGVAPEPLQWGRHPEMTEGTGNSGREAETLARFNGAAIRR